MLPVLLAIFLVLVNSVLSGPHSGFDIRDDDSLNLHFNFGGDENNDAESELEPSRRNEDVNDDELRSSQRDDEDVEPLPLRRGHHIPQSGDPLRIRVDPKTKKALRIRGGNRTDSLNFPYMAAIIINGRLWCAGAIVDTNWVITAAHCLNYVLHVSPMKTLAKYVQVRVGSPRAHEGGQLVSAVGAVRHPKFEEEPVPHADVALIKLGAELEFGPYVNLLKIYEGMKEPYAQSFVVITGWGATRGSDTSFKDHTSDLLTGRLKVRSQHYCIDAYDQVNGFMFTEDFFCASLRNGTRDACLFDAGAPAVQQNHLMGIMSFGPERCGHEYQPAVFIKAFYFRDFVRQTISSYKSTQDLIEAMAGVDEVVRRPIHLLENDPTDSPHLNYNTNEYTLPDEKHDKK